MSATTEELNTQQHEHPSSDTGNANGNASPSVSVDALSRLRKSLSLSARAITPHDTAEYDIERSTFALNYRYSPSLIIVCASTSDVVQAVKYCRSTGQDFTVAGGM
jgi:hypothetical protein